MRSHPNGDRSHEEEAGRPLPSRVVTVLRRDVPLAMLDAGVVLAAYLGPLALRFEGAIPGEYWTNFWVLLPLILLVHLSCNYLLGLYRQMWRFASVQEAQRIVVSGAAAGTLIVSAAFIFGRDGRPLPLSVMILGAVLALVGFGAIRFQSRLFAIRRRSVIEDHRRVLLVGAGEAASMVLRDIRRSPFLGMEVVGILDDDRRKMGVSLLGVRVMGNRAAIPPLVRDLGVHSREFRPLPEIPAGERERRRPRARRAS